MICPHGHASPNCPITGCESSRPAMRLEDWIRASTAPPREPDHETLAPPRVPVAPISDEERAARERAGREHARRLDELAKRDNASGDITRGRGFIGVREDGRTNPGAFHWSYCYGRQPVFVKGAIYADAEAGRKLAGMLSETNAQRQSVEVATRRLTARQIANALHIPLDKARRLVTERNKEGQE